MGLVSLRSSRPGESTDMQYDPFRSSRGLDLTWPQGQTLTMTFQCHFIYGSTRLNETNTTVPESLLYILKLKILPSKNFLENFESWPLVTWILTWAQKWPKWFRNDFLRAFERRLSFFPTTTRSRDHGGRSSAAAPQKAMEKPSIRRY